MARREKNHACSVCSRRFRNEQGLADHQRDSHGAPAVFRAREMGPPKVDPKCIECGALATLTTGRTIYPHRPDLFAKQFYLCKCGAYCGCHPNTAIPLGYPCGVETRKARSAAHGAFDPLWKHGSLSRREAYVWLAATLGIDDVDCHIGMMTADLARRVVMVVNNMTAQAA